MVLGSLGALALGYVVTLYARRYAGAGAIYEYLTHGAHPTVGVFSSGLYFLGMCWLGAGGVFIILGIQLHDFGVIHLYDLDIPWWVWGAALALVVFALNHFGVRLAVRAQLVLAAISAVPLILLAVVIIGKGGDAGNTLGVQPVARGVETPSSTASSSPSPCSSASSSPRPSARRPRSHAGPSRSRVLSTIAITAVFYIWSATRPTSASARPTSQGRRRLGQPRPRRAREPRDPLRRVVAREPIIDLVVILDTVAVALAFTVGAARGFFALGRDRLLPGVVRDHVEPQHAARRQPDLPRVSGWSSWSLPA